MFPNNTILRKKRIGKILTTSIKHLETFHLMREYPGLAITVSQPKLQTKIEKNF